MRLRHVFRFLPLQNHFYFARVCGHTIPGHDMAQVALLWSEGGVLFQLCFETLLLQVAQHSIQTLHVLCYGGRENNNIIQVQ